MRNSFIFAYVTLVLVGLLLPSWLTLPALSQGIEPKTYTIWSVSVSGSSIISLQTIPDINGDGYEDVFVASGLTGNGYLILVDGKTGSIIRTTSPLGYEPSEATHISGYIAVAKTGGIDVYEVYDTQIIYRYGISASASDVTPEKLQTFDGTDLVFIDGTNVKCILLSTGGEKWTRPGTITVEDLLVLSSQRAVYTWRDWLWNRWNLLLMDNNGNELTRGYIRGSTYSDYVYLNSYDQTHFLYTKTNDTMTILRCDSIIGDTVTILWETQIDKWKEGFAIVDTNNDGMKEVIAPWGGYLSVYSGANGALLYMTDIDAYEIGDVAVMSDVDGDGFNDVTVYTYPWWEYLVSFRYSTYGVWWEEWYGYNGIEAIEDVDGDGLKDVIAAEGNNLYCYWGYYDDNPPSIELVSPANNTYITSKNITFQVDASDSQSGIDNVQIVVDWSYYDGVYNPTTGYYEVALTLSEGEHSWYACAYDKVGYGGYSEKTATAYLTIDATPPTVSITSPQNETYLTSSNVSVSWYGSDDYGGTGIEQYRVRLDTGSWIDVGTETSHTFTNVDDGGHTVYVRAVDKAGNTKEVSVSFSVDTTPPSVTITSPTSGADFETTSVTVTWSGSDEISGIDYYMVRMDDGSWINVDTSTSYTFTDLSEEPHVATVKAVDKVGYLKEDSVSFTVGREYAAELIGQAESEIDSAKAAGFWSGDAKSLLDKAISEYGVATQEFEAGDYESAKAHAQNAMSYVDQAYAVESSFKTVLGIIGVICVATVAGIATYFLKIRKRKKAQKAEKQGS